MTIVPNTIAAAVIPLSAVAGSKCANYLGQAGHSSEWITPLLGPMGALVGTLLAIRWLLGRLDKAEVKADTREAERDKNLTLIAAMTVQNQTIIEQNSRVLADVELAIRRKSKDLDKTT